MRNCFLIALGLNSPFGGWGAVNLCPAENGRSVHKARALLNSIYGTVIIYEDCQGYAEGRLAYTEQNTKSKQLAETWQIELFPNPAQDKVTIVTNQESEILSIVVRDLTGRIIVNSKIKTNNHAAVMELNIINGAYMTTIKNEQGKTINKKLLIAK